MSNTYYYFSATLPMLSFKGKLPFASEGFLSDCQKLLTSEEYAMVEYSLIPSKTKRVFANETVTAWNEFDRSLRNELVWFRAQRMNKEAAEFLRGSRSASNYITDLVQQALKDPNLLEAEMLLDKARWQFLDDLVAGHFMDFEFIFTYGIKLKMLERHHEIETSKGADIFEELKNIEVQV